MIQVHNLTFSYLEKKIINNFEFNINDGDTIFIKGKNGLGKTTFLKLIAGILKPDSGSIFIKQDAVITFIPSRNNGLYPRLTGIKNIELFSNLLGINIDTRIESWSTIDVFKSALATRFNDCSQGMKQILNLFILTMNKPDVILGDEIFKHFDESTKNEVIGKIIQEFPTTTKVFVTHDQICWPSDFSLLEGDSWF